MSFLITKTFSSHDKNAPKAHDSDEIVRPVVREYPFKFGPGYEVVKPKARRTMADPSVIPTGKDDGKGGTKLIQTYVDHVLHKPQHRHGHPYVRPEYFTDKFNASSFDEKLNSFELRNIPYQSCVHSQRIAFPKVSSDLKKFFVFLTDRLKHDDPTLVRARLNGMNINDFTLTKICSGIVRNHYLQYLMLHNNAITDQGVDVLCRSLQFHPTFHTLWLGSCRITDVGMRNLAELCHLNHNIKEINVSNKWPSEIWAAHEREMHPHVSYIGADHLARFLRKGSGLTSLSLNQQRLRDDGASLLFEAVIDLPLRSLNLSANELGDRCCTTLKRVLPQNPILEELILSRNEITSVGAGDIAYGLAYNQLLGTLDLSSNKIDELGLHALFRCLEYNYTIKALITVGNQAVDDRAESVATTRNNSIFSTLMPSNDQISSLSSGNTPFSPAGTSASVGMGGSPMILRRGPPSRRELRASLSMSSDEQPSSPNKSTVNNHNTPTKQMHTSEEEGEEEDDNKYDKHHRPPRRSFADMVASPFARRGSVSLSRSPSMLMLSIDEDSPSHQNIPNITAATVASVSREESVLQMHGIEVHGKRGLTRSFAPISTSASASLTQQMLMQHQQQEDSNGGGGGAMPMSIEQAIAQAVRNVMGNDNNNNDTAAVTLPAINTNAGVRSPAKQRPAKKQPQGITAEHDLVQAKEAGKKFATATTTPSRRLSANRGGTTRRSSLVARRNSVKLSSLNPFLEQKHDNDDDEDNDDHGQSPLTSPPSKAKRRFSQHLGKTLGVPKMTSMGIRPIRTSISTYSDSGQHVMYLKVATEDDPAHARPYSFVKVGLDRERHREEERQRRQTALYKAQKAARMMDKPKEAQQLFEPKVQTVPQHFWRDWRMKVRLEFYPKGIDRTAGTKSTHLEPIKIPPPPRDPDVVDEYAKYERRDPTSPWNRFMEYTRKEELSYQKHLGFRQREFTPGQIIAARKKEQFMKRQQKMKEEQELVALKSTEVS